MTIKKRLLIGIVSFFLWNLGAQESQEEITFFFPMGSQALENSDLSARARAETLTHFDRLLEWFLTKIDRDISYKTVTPPIVQNFQHTSDVIVEFCQKYGYFSSDHPIIAKATSNKEDLQYVNELFLYIHENVIDPIRRRIAVAEAISKVLAYRDLSVGDKVEIPSFLIGEPRRLISYQVDEVFDLWHKMPAFGLISEDKKSPSLLIFRGTDLSLDRRSGWASVISDFDLSGPGYSAFRYAKYEISSWLKKVESQNQKACPFGFSLGGVMVMYTALFEAELIDKRCVMAFNPPGVNKELLQRWEDMQPEEQPHLILFVNKGDPVSKWGYLIGKAYELRSPDVCGPIQAHNVFMNGQKEFDAFQVDVEEENSHRQD